MKKWFQKKVKEQEKRNQRLPKIDLKTLFGDLRLSSDFVHYQHKRSANSCWISYFRTLVNDEMIHRVVLQNMYESSFHSLKELKALLPVEDLAITDNIMDIQNKIMEGFVAIQIHENSDECLLIPATLHQGRQVAPPEVEYSVVGPKEAFIESIDTNINLVRKRLPIPKFHIKEMRVGKVSKTRVAVLYIDGIASQENVNTALQRITDIEYDQIVDSSFIRQIITDNSNSPFPQFIDTERPDRVAAVIAEGKVAIIVDGSPSALTGPTNVTEFFSAFDDYFSNWVLASGVRLIRLFGVAFSVLSTPLYVAVLTYHYEIIPKDMLATLISSRRDIPFPPYMEVIVLELIIELLREAGARLPSKVGQTIGIVGGIVIGTASVAAGLTSNVLLIIVALAALSSFTTPVYQMGNAIRLIRFPFILAAQMWGFLGVGMCFGFFLTHLLRLTSLGRPYLEPIYPPRIGDLKDALFRLPMSVQSKRPMNLRPEDPMRFNQDRARKKKDIDE